MSEPPFRAIYFDCDSTLTRIEGIDELCRQRGEDANLGVQAATRAAMDGELPLEEVYADRLAKLAPRREEVLEIGRRYVAELLPCTRELISALTFLGKRVGIVSGGMLGAVLVLAQDLGVPAARVHAVPLRFAADGSFAGFDRASLLWRGGGKALVMRAVRERPVLFVGDGVTDLETAPVVDLFVGFGGVIARPAVRQGAAAFLDGPDLRGLLDLALGLDEKELLAGEPRFAHLLRTEGA